jgi:hypothetical protein
MREKQEITKGIVTDPEGRRALHSVTFLSHKRSFAD